MASCTIAFVDRCGRIAPDSKGNDPNFRVHDNILHTLQLLYEDLQYVIANKNGTKNFKYHHRYKRIRDFNENGGIIAGPDDDYPDGFDSDTDDGVLVEEDKIISSLQDAAVNSDDINCWKELSLQQAKAALPEGSGADKNEATESRYKEWAGQRKNKERDLVG